MLARGWESGRVLKEERADVPFNLHIRNGLTPGETTGECPLNRKAGIVTESTERAAATCVNTAHSSELARRAQKNMRWTAQHSGALDSSAEAQTPGSHAQINGPLQDE
jgi:hypothetical protein